MNEILRSNARVASIGDACTASVAAVSVVAVMLAAPVFMWTGIVWLAVAAPSSAIVLAVAITVPVQRRALRQHKALCDTIGRAL